MVFESCKRICQPAQTTLESFIPGIPKDAVWGGAQNSVYSFTVSVILTKGNYIAGAKSALLAVIATVIYALIVAFFAQFPDSSGKKSDPTIPLELFFITSGATYLISEMAGPKIEVMISIFAAGIPNAIKYPVGQTPFFGTIVT